VYFYYHELDNSGNIVTIYRSRECGRDKGDWVCAFKSGSKISLNVTHALLFGDRGSRIIDARSLTRHLMAFLGQRSMTASKVFEILCQKGLCTKEDRRTLNGKPHYLLPTLICNIDVL